MIYTHTYTCIHTTLGFRIVQSRIHVHASLRFPPLVRKTVGPKTKTRKQARHGTSEASLSFSIESRRRRLELLCFFRKGDHGIQSSASRNHAAGSLDKSAGLSQKTLAKPCMLSRTCHGRFWFRGQEAGLLAVLHRTCVCRDMVNGQADDLMHLFMNIAQARPTAGSTARNASCLRKIVLCLQALCVTGADGVQRTMA